MKYTISQYAHDSFRLHLIETELKEIKGRWRDYGWAHDRVVELVEQKLTITQRMDRYERLPQNR